MEKKIKIFGLSVEFGDSIPNFEKIDDLIVKTAKHIVTAKKDFIAFSKVLNSMDGSVQILEFMKEFEVRTEKTEISRRRLTAEEKAAIKIAKENARVEELQALAMQRRQGSIKQLESEIAKLRIVYENLSRTERNTAQGQAMKTHLAGLRKEMRELRMETGDFTNNIGNYMSGLYNKTTMMIAGVMGFVGTFKRFISELYSPFQDLEYRMAMVKAISGATDEEFEMLNATARGLGATTEYTATEVAGLELAYARMGFVPEQIRDMAAATLDLATATGENLEKTADTVATTLRGFQLAANQSQRVADVMAKSFNSSSLRLDYFTESMKYVAPIANAANISLEETVAMLGVLADRGIRGSAAGTALRRIFSEISKSGGDVNQRLAELSQKGLTLSGAMDEVGKYAMTALKVLTDAKGDVDGLTDSLNDANGAAKEAADIIRDTSQGDWDVLLSAITEKLIAIGEWLSPFARKSMQFLTWVVTNLKTIIAWVGTYLISLKALQALKTTYLVISNKVVLSETAFGRALQVNMLRLRNASAATKLLAAAKLLLTGNIKAATVAFKMFTATLMKNPFGAIAVLIATAITAFVSWRTRVRQAREESARFNREMAELDQNTSAQIASEREKIKYLTDVIHSNNTSLATRRKAIAQLNEIIPTYNGYLTDEGKLINDNTEAIKKYLTEKERELQLRAYDDKYVELLQEREKIEPEYEAAQSDLRNKKTNSAYYDRPIVDVLSWFGQTDLQKAQTRFDKVAAQLEANNKKLEKIKNKRNEILGSQLNDGRLVDSTDDDDKSKKKWSLSNDQEHNAELLKLKQQLHSGAIASEQDYQDKVLELEIATLTKRIALNKEKGTDLLKLKQQLEDKQYQYRQKQKKEEEKYNENRRQSAQKLADYEIANEESRINAMRDGIDKKMALNDLATRKNEQTAFKEYETTIKRLDKEQAAYAEGSTQYAAIEQEKIRIKAAYEAKAVNITASGANERLRILKSASNEELLILSRLPQYAAEAQQVVNEKIAEQRKATDSALLQAQGNYLVEMELADTLYNRERDRKAARLQAEVDVRQAKYKTYEAELRMLAQLGQFDSARYGELVAELQQLKSELTNLGRGQNADGTGGNWLSRVLGLDSDSIKQIRSAALDVARSISDAIAQVSTQASQRRLSLEKDRIQEEYDAEVEKLESKRKKGIISEKKYQKELDKLEKEKKKKDKEAEKKAFEEQKRISILQAIANTALAIINAFATMPWPAAPIAAATAAATGAVQIATISAQKYYRRGGVIDPIDEKMGILRGPSHGHGGMPIFIGDRYVGEAEGDELFAIVNKRDTQTLGALSMLNSRHGKKFAQGGTFTRTGVSAPVDYVGETTNFVTQSQLVQGYTDLMKFVQKQTDAINRRIDRMKVYVVQSDIAKANKEAETLRAQTTF